MILPQEQARNERAQKYILDQHRLGNFVFIVGTEIPCLVKPRYGLCVLGAVHWEAYRQLRAQGLITVGEVKEWYI